MTEFFIGFIIGGGGTVIPIVWFGSMSISGVF